MNVSSALGAVSTASSFTVLSASAFACTETLIIVLFSVTSTNGSVDSGARLTLLSRLLSDQLLQLIVPHSENWKHSGHSGLLLWFTLILLNHLIKEVLEESDFVLSCNVFFFTSSEVLKFVSVAVNGTKVFISNSLLSTNRHVGVRAVVAADFERGTSSVRTDLHSHAVKRALVVVGMAIDSADWSELLFAVAWSQTRSWSYAQFSETV